MQRNKLVSLAILLVLVAMSFVVYAGWDRNASGTFWNPKPTCATLWYSRERPAMIYPANPIKVYEDTIYSLTGSNTVKVCTGLWEQNSDNCYVPIEISSDMYSQIKNSGEELGIQWEVSSNTYLQPKL